MNYDEVIRKVMYEELYRIKVEGRSMPRLSKLDYEVLNTYVPTILSLLEDLEEQATDIKTLREAHEVARLTLIDIRDQIAELREDYDEAQELIMKQRNLVRKAYLNEQ